jgi:hypothetical protein
MSVLDDYRRASDNLLTGLRRVLPLPLRKLTVQLFGQRTSFHRSCRFYRPSGVSIGKLSASGDMTSPIRSPFASASSGGI